MVKKLSKRSLKKTGCKKGCKGRVLEYGKYCPCIERKLPRLGSMNSVKSKSRADMGWVNRDSDRPDRVMERNEARVRERDEVKGRLLQYGLAAPVAELVIARYFDSLSFPELAKSLGWVSVDSASYHLKQALKTLRERKFKL